MTRSDTSSGWPSERPSCRRGLLASWPVTGAGGAEVPTPKAGAESLRECLEARAEWWG